MPKQCKVKFTRCLIEGPARLYWTNVERNSERLDLPPIERWDEMLLKLREKYVPPYFRSKVLHQLGNLIQGSQTIDEYTTRFDELLVRCDIREDSSFTLSMFKHCLRSKIKMGLVHYCPRVSLP